MENSYVQKIRDLLGKNDNIAIAVGRNPSIDEMAAGLSLYLLLRDAKKNVSIACPTEPIVELSNLVGIDKVAPRLDSQSGDLTVSFPYAEGEIDKVSYTLENGFLNIIVKATNQGLSFDEKDVRYIKGGGQIGVLFAVGAPVLSDLKDVISSEAVKNARIINIDNKRENQGYGDVVIASEDFSSLSELVGDIILSLGFNIDRDVAQNLLSGITYATKNFQEERTSPLAFEIASLLMRSGARREAASRSRQELSARGRGYNNDGQNVQNRNVRDDNDEDAGQDEQKTPNDWLAPKVYKGSSNF